MLFGLPRPRDAETRGKSTTPDFDANRIVHVCGHQQRVTPGLGPGIIRAKFIPRSCRRLLCFSRLGIFFELMVDSECETKAKFS